MKIEIAESLGASWLKHVKKCFMVQQNWKISPCWDDSRERMDEIEGFVTRFKRLLNEEDRFLQYDVFGDSTVAQIISQTECDVMGSVFENAAIRFNALEVAFHENGLQYGNKFETASKVISKLFRIAMVLYYYQGVKKGNIYFASPKVNPATLQVISPIFTKMKEFFVAENFEIDFDLFFNEDFKNKILDPVLECVDQVSDSNELWLRALQLQSVLETLNGNAPARIRNENPEIQGEKIGTVVRNELIPMLQTERVTSDEIADFLTLAESKAQFGINLPLLMKEADCVAPEVRIRYYATPIVIRGERYKVCSQWFIRSLGKVRSWIALHSNDDT